MRCGISVKCDGRSAITLHLKILLPAGSVSGLLAAQGPQALQDSVERHRLKAAAMRSSSPLALLQVIRCIDAIPA